MGRFSSWARAVPPPTSFGPCLLTGIEVSCALVASSKIFGILAGINQTARVDKLVRLIGCFSNGRYTIPSRDCFCKERIFSLQNASGILRVYWGFLKNPLGSLRAFSVYNHKFPPGLEGAFFHCLQLQSDITIKAPTVHYTLLYIYGLYCICIHICIRVSRKVG